MTTIEILIVIAGFIATPFLLYVVIKAKLWVIKKILRIFREEVIDELKK